MDCNNKIIVKNLSYKYKNKVIFDCTNVSFSPSDITIIFGDNGQGKTTLLHLFAGILSDENKSIHNPYRNPMCSFQTPVLLNRTVYKNILHTAKALKINNPQGTTIQALHDTDLHHLKDMPASTLSGGQKMRLQIGRMMVSNSNLWLLDEPYAGLDMKSTLALDIIIKKAKLNGIKIFIVTHNIDVIKKLGNSVSQVKNKKITKPISKKSFLNSLLVKG